MADTPDNTGTLAEHMVAVDRAMREQNKSRADLARFLGLDSSQVTRLFKKGGRRLQLHEAKALGEWLNIPLPGSQLSTSGSDGNVTPLPGLVPLYGYTGASSATRRIIAEQRLLGYVPAHPNQAHMHDAFALQVSDVSMSPRYEPGETVYLAPNQWPRRGQDCVLITTENESLVKRFERRSDLGVHLHQLNPDEDLVIAAEEVSAVHAVVGRG